MAELVLVALFAYLVWRFFIRNWLAKRRADQWPSQDEPPAAPAKLSGAAWDTSKNKTSNPATRQRHTQSLVNSAIKRKAPTALRERPYAEIERGGSYYPLSSDEVADLFAPYRERLKELRTIERDVKRIAKRYDSTGKIDLAELSHFMGADKEAERAADEAQTVLDLLFFKDENSDSKFFKIIDDLYGVEAEISDTLEEIEFIGELIRDGEHSTCPVPDARPAKPKRQRKSTPKE